MIETGYVMPHWPRPWGRDAGAVEQLVIEQEFRAAGVARPQYGITGWVILTLIQHATEDQVARWVLPALRQEVIWCQLFSEPDAGSDAAGVKTRGTRVEGGWLVNGQKVWTSGAHLAAFGLATIRTDPDAAKHQGITTMVIDMHAEGVEVRPLKMVTGHSEFNEVFFNDVFVPDDDVVGPGQRRLDGCPGHAGQRERLHRRRPGRRVHAARHGDRPLRRPSRAAGRRGGADRPRHRPERGDGGAQHAQRPPGRGRWRARARGQRDQAGALGDRARGRRDHGRAGRSRHRLLGRRRSDDGDDGADASRHVDRRWDVGDQAQPDRRAHPRAAPGSRSSTSSGTTPNSSTGRPNRVRASPPRRNGGQ